MSDLPALGLPELSEQLRFILDLGVAVAVALIGGAIAVRLRQPAVLGYLLAGIGIRSITRIDAALPPRVRLTPRPGDASAGPASAPARKTAGSR